MTPSFGHFTVILLYLVLTYAKRGKNSNARDDASGDDNIYEVVSNITRFNTVLQELIDKFNVLNNIYESEELVAGEYSTDTGDDNSKIFGKPRNQDSETEHPFFLGTSMFFAEDIKENSKKLPEKKAPVVETAESNVNTNKNHIKKRKKKKNVKEIDSKDTASEDFTPNKNVRKKQIIQTETFPKNSIWHDINVNKPLHLQTQKEIVYTDNNNGLAKKQSSALGINAALKDNKQYYTNNNFNFYPINLEKRVNRTSRRDLRSRLKIDKPKKTKTSKLEPERSLLKARQTVKKRKNRPKITYEPIIYRTYLTDGEKMETPVFKKIFTTEEEAWTNEGDFTLRHDQGQTSILRKAFGNACVKVVIRKCYKACRAAEKNGCKKLKCSSKFSSKMKQVSKTGCIKEFVGGSSNNQKSKKERNRYDLTEDDMIDLTRRGYIDCACLPPTSPYERQHVYFRDGERRLNVLRDRFEKACQQESIDKCEHACYFALNGACFSAGCAKAMKNTLKKACRDECKHSYSSPKKSKSYSGTSSSGSSSGTGTDSSESSESSQEKGKKTTKKSDTSPTPTTTDGEATTTSQQQTTLTITTQEATTTATQKTTATQETTATQQTTETTAGQGTTTPKETTDTTTAPKETTDTTTAPKETTDATASTDTTAATADTGATTTTVTTAGPGRKLKKKKKKKRRHHKKRTF